MIKITKIRPYRVNFRCKGYHFSINDSGEYGEEYVELRCKELPDFIRTVYKTRGSHWFLRKKGWIHKVGCYQHYDKKWLVDELEKNFKLFTVMREQFDQYDEEHMLLLDL